MTVFDSTDALRSASPLRHSQSVTLPGPVTLEHGGVLPHVTVCYETYGSLNAQRDNAVLICHALSGDSHVARHTPDDDPGWWDEMVGPGKHYGINTDELFVICPNVLGGCRGTTGPGSINPDTGRPYGRSFPVVTIGDMVDVQAMLLDHLGIDTLRGVVGGSLGGHQALMWAIRHPQRVGTCVALATSPRLTSQALAFDVVARNAILRDPDYHDGQYYDQPTKPHVGLAIARMLGHITYLSGEAMDAKFDPDRHEPRDLDTAFEKKFSVGSYLAYQGHKFVERFDANSYVSLSLAMDLFDLGRTPEQRRAALSPARCRWVIVSFSSDWLFPPKQSRQIVAGLTRLGQQVTYAEITTDAGHDAFLLRPDIAQFADLVRYRLTHRRDEVDDANEEDRRIAELIEPGSSVLDLGCGTGALLSLLRQRGHEKLYGVEVNQASILAAAKRGFDVLDFDLNRGLPDFDDQQFDVSVLSATLQTLVDVERLLTDMVRVSRRAIVSIPNFAFRDLRRVMVEQGRSPKAAGRYGHEWYNTPNRRFPSIHDFHDFCHHKRWVIHRAVYLDTTRSTQVTPQDDPNLNADTAIFVLGRDQGESYG